MHLSYESSNQCLLCCFSELLICILFQAFCFHADKELLREPRIVRVGLIQNSIAVPTTAHFLDQKRAIFGKLKPIIDAAGVSGVNILCLQVCHLAMPLILIDFLPGI